MSPADSPSASDTGITGTALCTSDTVTISDTSLTLHCQYTDRRHRCLDDTAQRAVKLLSTESADRSELST